MAISIDHSTTPRTIYIPKADTTLVSAASAPFPEIRSLDVETFHNDLRTLMTEPINDVYPNTHDHTVEGTLGAITYFRRVDVSDEYAVEFEDGQYRVRLLGGDSNVEDRQVANQVSVSTFNSTGNSVVTVGSGVLPSDVTDIENAIFDRLVETGFSFEALVRIIAAAAAGKINQDVDGVYQIRDINDTKDRIEGDDAANNGRDITATDGT